MHVFDLNEPLVKRVKPLDAEDLAAAIDKYLSLE